MTITAPNDTLYPPKPIPQGAWDTHHHIFEPDIFPFAAGRHFTPARASLSDLQSFERGLGVQNVCIAHGLSYGPDCSSLLYYLGQFNAPANANAPDQETSQGECQARGICVLDISTVTDEVLDAYHAAGVRSVRIDFFRENAMHDVDAQKRLIENTATRLNTWWQSRVRKRRGQDQDQDQDRGKWSIQIQQPHLEHWVVLRATIAACPVPVVVDHFALVAGSSHRAGDRTTCIQDSGYLRDEEREGLFALRDLLREGNLWIKLSAPYRCSNLAPGYEDLKWLVRLLVDANPERVLWGSDWPHTQRHEDRAGKSTSQEEAFLQVNDKRWVEGLSRWMSQREWQLMWVENPRVLYCNDD
ncbi:hypothetical protein P170DRAFT_366681 [Aspergillus steynii IBT 23096]|uniref:Amidohydrolase-related domain-containing protein n=1 Tax=Aspergillus steynii IBT 23096 TaxID=1392250 RepID=A0A2I2FWD6_9EURO|nr:uncharacterized protein P170DRAFT_366681 [Aspergillus steynii IBT 23096]PLB44934.1 hypothetical protein P170DRAFT_366681 [Aspergillus steynii IBT 23096]